MKLMLMLLQALGVCAVIAAGQPLDNTTATRIAWVGNSYTFFQDLPGMLTLLAASANRTVTHGSSLFGHANTSTPTGAATAALLNATGPGGRASFDFDFVVLQDQSETPGGGRDTDAGMGPGQARALSLAAMPAFYAPRLRALGATAIMYSTWGRRNPAEEDPKNADVYPSFHAMNAATAAGYVRYAQALLAGAVPSRIAPAGRAFELVHNETAQPLSPGSAFDALYHSGAAGTGGHQSTEGTYLIASVFYGTVFGASPRGLAYAPRGMPGATRAYLQDVAHRAVFGPAQ